MFSRSPQFEKLLDKATSNLRLEPDWPTIIQICDLIRQGDVTPKYALGAIKKKLANSNPHVALFSLQVLESCVKNCGILIHEEIGTKAYMEQLREIVKTTQHENVRTKILELLQAWAFAFRNTPKYRAVQDTVNIMKAEGYKFPGLKESDAMFSADTAPEWADGQCCHRCRVQFTVMQRKHHCRACGQVFCNQCTSKTCTLPKFGIEKEVRVCEPCYEKFTKPTSSCSSPASTKSDELPIEYLNSSLAQQSQAPPGRKSEAELREEEELQLAIALSQSEAESAGQKGSIGAINTRAKTSYSPPPSQANNSVEDAELARYLNRSYWQKQSTENTPSAPNYPIAVNKEVEEDKIDNVKDNSEMDEFIYKLKMQLEMFVNRMKSNSSRGRSISNDSSVQTLFINITNMHSQLLQYVNCQDDKRVYYEGLQDKLTQVRDARAALDALREEHREQMRREAEAAERQRQIQMAHKLDIMRKKKQEYLQYQRQLALQRIQEQEREMALRQEQQKQQNMRGSYGGLPYYPPGYDNMTGYPPAPFPPAQAYHGMMMGHVMDQMGSSHMLNSMGPGIPPHMMPGPPQAMGPQSLPPHPQGQVLPGPPPQVMQGPPPQVMQGPPPQVMQGPPPQVMQGPPPQVMQGPPPQVMQGPPPQVMQGPPPQVMPGPPPGQVLPQGMAVHPQGVVPPPSQGVPGGPQVMGGPLPPQTMPPAGGLPPPPAQGGVPPPQPMPIHHPQMVPGGPPPLHMMGPPPTPGGPPPPQNIYQNQYPPQDEDRKDQSSTELISFD